MKMRKAKYRGSYLLTGLQWVKWGPRRDWVVVSFLPRLDAIAVSKKK